MLKNILKLDGAKELNKKDQKTIKGGLFPTKGGKLCSAVCPSANYGVLCDLHAGCPNSNDGMCDGNGGYYAL